MRIKKPELAMLIVTAVFIGATAGYVLARVPAAGTFEISAANITVMPSLQPVSPGAAPVTYEPPEETIVVPLEEPETEPPPVSEPPEAVTVTPPSPEPEYTPKPEPQDTVNVNTAGLEELQRLPGVGPVLAQRIIDERESGGAFISAEDLQRVKGIGEKTVEKMKQYVIVQG